MLRAVKLQAFDYIGGLWRNEAFIFILCHLTIIWMECTVRFADVALGQFNLKNTHTLTHREIEMLQPAICCPQPCICFSV